MNTNESEPGSTIGFEQLAQQFLESAKMILQEMKEVVQQPRIVYNFGGATIKTLAPNGTITIYEAKHEEDDLTESQQEAPLVEENIISNKELAEAILNCQEFFWGNSSYAVVFCVCRDDCDMTPNKSAFERLVELLPYQRRRSFNCPTGTLTNAFSNNPFFNLNIDKWTKANTSVRVIKLRDELRKCLGKGRIVL
jgi:hypothetical protein